MSSKMRGIIPWFAQNPVAANLLLILIISLGLMQMGKLRKEAFPSLSPNSLTVSVTYDSGSAQQSEEGLAIKIEEELEDVLGIKTITSSSTTTGTSVSIEMKDDYDLDTLLRDVKPKVDAISTFPTDADKPVIEKAEREEHALWLQLYGEVGRHTLQTLAEELKDDLLANTNVNRVAISGDLDPMISVEIDEAQLQSYGLSLSDVEEAINNESGSSRTAVLRDKNLYLQLQASEQAYLKEAFSAIPLITLEDGSRIHLGDVAKIDDTFDDETPVLSRFNGHTSIALQVITTGQDDIFRTVAGAKKVVEEFRTSGSLPDNVQLTSWYDRSTMITERLELLAQNALTGFLIVFFLLAMFLNLTVAFWVAMGLPFIFFGTLYFMGDSFAGLSLNEFTTFGFIMALGIVVSGIEDNLEPGQPQLFMALTPEGRALGFTTDMLAEQVLQAFSGQVVQRFQRSADEVEVKVRYPEGARKSVSDVLNADVRNSDGTVVPLTSVASITYGYTRDTITRIDGKRAVYISADVDKDIMSSTELVGQLQKELVPKLKQQYPSLDIDFSGEAEEQAETETSMVHMFILALFIIYFLLAIPLKSYMQPFLIMTAIPFGIVGAVLGHWINDLSLGILSLNGIIALAGVVVNDSLLLVSTFNDLKRSTNTSLVETVSWAGKSRLRAVLLTSLTTVAGLLPLLYETSHQAQFLIPAAVSLAYGIMFATVITPDPDTVLLVVHHDICRFLAWFRGWINPFAQRKETC